MSDQIAVLLIGQPSHPDLDDVGLCFADCDLEVREPRRACELSDDWQPELIVLVSERPGDLASLPMTQLESRFPLSRWITVVGSWCEGETRTGQPADGCHRIYWHHFRGQARRELSQLAKRETGFWSLPRTATNVDRTLLLSGSRSLEGLELSVVVDSFGEFEMLDSALSSAGAICQWARTPAHRSSDRVLWCIGNWTAATTAQLDEMQEPKDGLALVDFPRHDQKQRLAESGFDVLGRPYWVDDLLSQLATWIR